MTSQLFAVTFITGRPQVLARFWAGVLGREMIDDPRHGVALRPDDEAGFRIGFEQDPEPKTSQNLIHFELTSTTLEVQQETVARALALGGRHTDVGQLPEEEHVVLADPDGNEFCVIEPGNKFLDGCGFLAALSCDGSAEVGYFWSAALGWPLVWDQDEETAIQSPLGGPKITWGGPPYMPRTGRDRLHFELTVPAGTDRSQEISRLVSLGATRVGDSGSMADPDGNEFTVQI